MNRVQYLGYIVDEHGVHVDPSNIQVIYDWKTSTTLIELQSFLGLTNFYQWFMFGFYHIECPPNQVTKGGGRETFVWGRNNNENLMI
jgi:hypothetical protein